MKQLSFSLLYLLFSLCARSQYITPEVISSAGNHFSTSGVSLSWTIGEPVFETIGSSSSQLTQGFHQPFLSLDGIDEQEEFSISVFPNPASGIINFTMNSDVQIENVFIYSMDGKLISSPVIYNNQADISALSAGAYLIKIETNKRLFTLRLLKN